MIMILPIPIARTTSGSTSNEIFDTVINCQDMQYKIVPETPTDNQPPTQTLLFINLTQEKKLGRLKKHILHTFLIHHSNEEKGTQIFYVRPGEKNYPHDPGVQKALDDAYAELFNQEYPPLPTSAYSDHKK